MTRSANPLIIRSVASMILFTGAQAEQDNKPPLDQSQYTLFNPLPSQFLGPMITDRPDKVEGPYTVAPGHFQLEFDAVTWARDHTKFSGENTKTKAYSIFAPNLRVGLLHNLELDLIFEGYNHVTVKDLIAGTATVQKGVGDLFLRFKYNFWGNDGKGKTALGVLPFVKFPTNQDNLGNKFYEGGVLVPFDISFTDDLSLGLMTGVSYIRSDNHNKYVYSFLNSASLGYQFTEAACVYVEIYTEKGSRWDVTLDVGTTYLVTKNFQLDTGINIGLSKAAIDYNPFIGVSVRF